MLKWIVVFEEELFNGSISTGININISEIKDIDGEDGTSFDSKIQGYSGKKFRKWEKTQLKEQGIDSSILENEEYFVIVYDEGNYETVDVIYSTGCHYNGNKYYTLVEMEEVINEN